MQVKKGGFSHLADFRKEPTALEAQQTSLMSLHDHRAFAFRWLKERIYTAVNTSPCVCVNINYCHVIPNSSKGAGDANFSPLTHTFPGKPSQQKPGSAKF